MSKVFHYPFDIVIIFTWLKKRLELKSDHKWDSKKQKMSNRKGNEELEKPNFQENKSTAMLGKILIAFEIKNETPTFQKKEEKLMHDVVKLIFIVWRQQHISI